MVQLTGKAAFITGGSQGIGREICIAYLKKGIKVCIADVDVTKGQETLKELQKQYGEKNVIFHRCNVTNENEFEAAIVATKAKFGRLDFLVNNAGVGGEADWKKIIDINLNGVIIGTLHGLQHLANDTGSKEGTMIINTASIVGINAMVIAPAYTASKHGCAGWSKCWGNEVNVAKTGVKVNAVCPEAADTALIRDLNRDSVNEERAKGLGACIEKNLIKTSTVAQAFVQLLEENVTGKLLVVSHEKGLYYSPYETYF